MANIKSFPNNQDVYIGAADVMRWHHGRTSGVFAAGGNAAVQALASPGMAVKVTNGTGWLSNANGDGIVWWIDTEQNEGVQLAIDQADSVLHRIDRAIVEWKTTTYVDYPEVKILKGTPASTPAAPALTNDGNVRQISLAQIYVKAGSTSVTSSAITDERLNTSVCGLVTEKVSVDTGTMQSQFATMLAETKAKVNTVLDDTTGQARSVLDAINQELTDLEAGTAVELKKLSFANTTVPVSAFVSDNTYQDFPFRAAVTLENVLSAMIPSVAYSVAALTDNNFAPVAECYNGGVYIYADSKPTNPVKIDTIICWRA